MHSDEQETTVEETAVDYFGEVRTFCCTRVPSNPEGSRKYLKDAKLRVRTCYINPSYESFPGREIENPPDWQPQSVSAHANASDVAKFFQEKLDYTPPEKPSKKYYLSGILCIEDGNYRENILIRWFDHYQQAFFGQQMIDGAPCCYAVAQDIVAHEFTHALTSWIVGFEYCGESGALDESYADIFAILIVNRDNLDIGTWNWNLGSYFSENYAAIRNLQDPGNQNCAEPQPKHMNDYLYTSYSDDNGGIHHNSGIHNKAAYNLLTSKDTQGNYLFDATSAAQLFYRALIGLPKKSGFIDSRRAIQEAAKTLFRKEATELKNQKLQAIANAFKRVGIKYKDEDEE
ncbi:MAG: M4 family metallopeptidase [Nostocaceae cyanobacterium]|nr:M4 family metallopeptidase [Nostocaceae cyanobacterium]